MLRGVRRAAILVAFVICLAAPATAGAKQLTRYDVGGGLAGRYDRLIVDGAGHAVQTGDSGDHRFTISSRQLRALKRELKAAKFRTLKRQYKPKFQVFDGTVQSVRYRGKAVSIYSGADNIPKRLSKVIRRLARLMR
jgi:hypothetical protein